jgi:GNAT superfamily N-acetyltransferase
MASLSSTKIKIFIKRTFPFIKYRWRIYSAFNKVVNFVYHRFTEISSENDLSQEFFFTRSYKLEIETVNQSNRDALTEFAENNCNQNMYKNWTYYFFKNKYNGFIALLQGNIIGYTWWWANNNNNNNDIKPPPGICFYNIQLKKDEVYGFNFFVAPQYRGNGNAIEFRLKVHRILRELGYRSIIGTHAADNIPAAWLYRTLGSKDIKSMSGYTFFNRIVFFEKIIFLKTSHRHPYYPFECLPLLSFRNIFKNDK